MTNIKIFLVEIRLKDWIAGDNRVVAFEQVIAPDEYSARHVGFEQFVTRTKFEPIMRRKWDVLNIRYADICAPDAVEL